MPDDDALIKFPRTSHLFWLGERPLRDDKLMEPADAERLLRAELSVEEKVDGANLGLSLDANGRVRAQSRGSFLHAGTKGQWELLWQWLAVRDDALRAGLAGVIAYGEWCYARHTVRYDALPDWFVLFDVYDRAAQRFWSRVRRDGWAREQKLPVAPLLAHGKQKRSGLETMLGSRSHLGRERAEGIYLRQDAGDWLEARAKLVRPGWVMADDTHWSARPLQTNRLAGDGGAPGGVH